MEALDQVSINRILLDLHISAMQEMFIQAGAMILDATHLMLDVRCYCYC